MDRSIGRERLFKSTRGQILALLHGETSTVNDLTAALALTDIRNLGGASAAFRVDRPSRPRVALKSAESGHAQMVRRSLLVIAVFALMQPARAVEVTEPEGAAHGYPAWCDIDGKKLADGEFRQWMENDRLHVVITYKFPDGLLYEEDALFRADRELSQEQWSFKESRNGKVLRHFAADFLKKTGSADIQADKEKKNVSENLDIEPGRTFAGFGFTLALANLRPRLVKGEQIELKAVGFTPVPTLKPQLVNVQISYGGLDRMKMGGRFYTGYRFIVHPEIPAIAKVFLKVPDTKVWLTYPAPAGFLRFEGPRVMPNDPLARVDLVSDSVSGPAEPVEKK